jgi:hypothetical protein
MASALMILILVDPFSLLFLFYELSLAAANMMSVM